MSGEKGNNLFEELDFTGFADELSEMTDTIEKEQEEISKEEESTLDLLEEDTPSSEETDEETDESTEEEESEESTEEEQKENENSSPLTPYAKLLVNEGILPNFKLEEFDGTAEGLKNAMVNEISKGIEYNIEKYKSQLPEEIKKLVDNYEEGVPLAVLLEIDKNRTEYKSITPDKLKEDKNLQKAILKDYYANTTSFSDSKISKLIQRSEDLDELEDESSSALTELIGLQDQLEEQARLKAIEDQKLFQKKQEETLNTFKTTLDKFEEIVPGVKLNKNIKDDIYKVMTTPVAYDDAGNPLNEITKYKAENPYEFDITLAYIFKATKGFKDWSILSKAGKNKAVNEFEESLKKQNNKIYNKDTKGSKSQANSEDLFDAISKIKF